MVMHAEPIVDRKWFATMRHAQTYYRVPVPDDSLAGFLRRMLDERGWTQSELAERSGIPQPRISAYITGRMRFPRPDTTEALDDAFGLPRGTFFQKTHGLHVASTPLAPGSLVIAADANPLLKEAVEGILALERDPHALRRAVRAIQAIAGPRTVTSGTHLA